MFARVDRMRVTRPASSVACLLALVVLAVMPSRGEALTLGPGASIVALGDSVAAGEGLGDGWSWNGSAWQQTGPTGAWDDSLVPRFCHQSASAYPQRVAAALQARITNLACTGATVERGIFTDRTDPADPGVFAPRQLGSSEIGGALPPNPLYDAARPDVVLLSAGANDVGLIGWLESCYAVDTTCALPGLEDSLAERLATMVRYVSAVLDEIQRRGQAAGKVPVVLVNEYPDLFPPSYPSGSCVDINPSGTTGQEAPRTLSAGELQLAHQIVDTLNVALRALAATHEQVLTVSAPSLTNHHYCSADPWFFGPSIAAGDWSLGRTNAAPFHPTAQGQDAIASQTAQVLQTLRAAGPLPQEPTPTPPAATPPTPTPTPAPKAPGKPRVSFGGRAISVPKARRVKLMCGATVAPANTRCRVTIRLGRSSRGKRLAVKTIKLPAGKSVRRTVNVALSKSAWKRLKRKRQLRVTITLLDRRGKSLSSRSRNYKVRRSAF